MARTIIQCTTWKVYPMKWQNKTIKWLRILHRDLGYLMVGITLIYGISGYLLNHMDGEDPAFRTQSGQIQLDKYLSDKQLSEQWNTLTDVPALNRTLHNGDDHIKLMLRGGIGIYDTHSGQIEYSIHEKKPFVYFINKLHYNKTKYWTIIADIYAFTLIFFALSGLFMLKGKNGLAGRGKWFVATGIIVPLLYLFWI